VDRVTVLKGTSPECARKHVWRAWADKEKIVWSVRLRLSFTEGTRSGQVNPTAQEGERRCWLQRETSQTPTAPYPFDAPATDQSFVSRQEIEMGRRKKKVLSILAVSGLMGLTFVAAEPALAGTNGQRILFCANGSDYQRVHVEGFNQNGNFMQVAFPVDLDKNQCSDPSDFYWVGDVKLTWMQSASGNFPRQETTCLIPRESPSDTHTCTPKALL
jgi:hypothetical protein